MMVVVDEWSRVHDDFYLVDHEGVAEMQEKQKSEKVENENSKSKIRKGFWIEIRMESSRPTS